MDGMHGWNWDGNRHRPKSAVSGSAVIGGGGVSEIYTSDDQLWPTCCERRAKPSRPNWNPPTTGNNTGASRLTNISSFHMLGNEPEILALNLKMILLLVFAQTEKWETGFAQKKGPRPKSKFGSDIHTPGHIPTY